MEKDTGGVGMSTCYDCGPGLLWRMMVLMMIVLVFYLSLTWIAGV